MASTWLNIATVALAWIGAAMLAFALFGDSLAQRIRRLRGTARKRCPKCWYDLSHAPENEHGSITCSECGHVIKRERQLYKGRCHWRLVGFAFITLLATYILNVTPGVRHRGIIAVVPTTALVLAMPWLGSPDLILIDDDQRGQITINNELSQEFFERLYNCSDLWRWQESMIVERALRGDRSRRPASFEWNDFYGEALHHLRHCHPYDEDLPWMARAEALVEVHIRTRAAWPAGVPIYAALTLDRWQVYRDHEVRLTPLVDGLSHAATTIYRASERGNLFGMGRGGHRWGDELLFLGVSDLNADAIAFEASIHEFDYLSDSAGRELRRQTLRVPIRIIESIDDVLEAVESPDLSQFLRDMLLPALLGSVGGERFSLRLWPDSFFDLNEAPAILRDVTIAFAIEVLRDGVVIGAATAWFATDDAWEPFAHWRPIGPIEMTWFDAREARFAEDAAWTLRLRSDPFTALRNFESDRYWKGEIEVPLRLDVWAER